jgi:hypothetical protein
MEVSWSEPRTGTCGRWDLPSKLDDIVLAEHLFGHLQLSCGRYRQSVMKVMVYQRNRLFSRAFQRDKRCRDAGSNYFRGLCYLSIKRLAATYPHSESHRS